MCAPTARARPLDSILNDRRLLCQPVCQHRTPGRQLSEHPTAVSVLVPLIRSTKKQQNEKKRFLKGGEKILRHRKKSPSPAQPSPTEKQKLDVVSHSALLSSSPGTPRAPEAAQFSESPRKGSRWSCAPAVKQKETSKMGSATQRTDGKKGRGRTASLPSPTAIGKERTPSPATSTLPRGPHLHSGRSAPREPGGPAWKMMGCRS